MPNDMQEHEAARMPSQEIGPAGEKRETSTRRLTREEGRAMLEEYEAIAEEFMQYLKEHNMLPKKCPARKVGEQEKQTSEQPHTK